MRADRLIANLLVQARARANAVCAAQIKVPRQEPLHDLGALHPRELLDLDDSDLDAVRPGAAHSRDLAKARRTRLAGCA